MISAAAHPLSRRVTLVTGKGGVGRTTNCIALARASAALGYRTLVLDLAESDDLTSHVATQFKRDSLPSTPIELVPNLFGATLRPKEGHARFLSSLLPKRLVNTALKAKAVQSFLGSAPSFLEMGWFSHLLSLLDEKDDQGNHAFERVIVDMPATGHTLALTGLPQLLLSVIERGPIPKAMRKGQAYLNDETQTAAWVVALPEMLPVTEAQELMAGLEKDGVHVGGLLLNRVPDDPFEAGEREKLDAWLGEKAVFGRNGFRRTSAARQVADEVTASFAYAVWVQPDLAKSPEEVQATLTDIFVDAYRKTQTREMAG